MHFRSPCFCAFCGTICMATTCSYSHLSIIDCKHLHGDGPETQDYALLSVDMDCNCIRLNSFVLSKVPV